MCNILSISNMRKVKGLIRKFPKLKMGPSCHSSLSLFSFLSCVPTPPLSLFPPREKRERESERERESHRPGNRFARDLRFGERTLDLAPSPDWLVNSLSISLSFRVFVFLGFR